MEVVGFGVSSPAAMFPIRRIHSSVNKNNSASGIFRQLA